MDFLNDELFHDSCYIINEKRSDLREGVLMKVSGPIGILNSKNNNGRYYTTEFWKEILSRPDVQEQIESRALVGCADHPPTFIPPVSLISHVLTGAKVNEKDNSLDGEAEILDTPNGRILATLFKAGVRVGASTRALGKAVPTSRGKEVQVESYKWGGFDFCFYPSAQNAYPQPVLEQVEHIINESAAEALFGNDSKTIEQTKEYYSSMLSKLGINSDLLIEKAKEATDLVSLNEGTNQSTGQSTTPQSTEDVEALKSKISALEASNKTLNDQLSESNNQVKVLTERINFLADEYLTASRQSDNQINESDISHVADTLLLENQDLYEYVRELGVLKNSLRENLINETQSFNSKDNNQQANKLDDQSGALIPTENGLTQLCETLKTERSELLERNSHLLLKLDSTTGNLKTQLSNLIERSAQDRLVISALRKDLRLLNEDLLQTRAMLYSEKSGLSVKEITEMQVNEMTIHEFESSIEDIVPSEIDPSSVFESTPQIKSVEILNESEDFDEPVSKKPIVKSKTHQNVSFLLKRI